MIRDYKKNDMITHKLVGFLFYEKIYKYSNKLKAAIVEFKQYEQVSVFITHVIELMIDFLLSSSRGHIQTCDISKHMLASSDHQKPIGNALTMLFFNDVRVRKKLQSLGLTKSIPT